MDRPRVVAAINESLSSPPASSPIYAKFFIAAPRNVRNFLPRPLDRSSTIYPLIRLNIELNPQPVPVLIKLLRDKDDWVRIEAMNSIPQTGFQAVQAIEPLRKIIATGPINEAVAAADALARINRDDPKLLAVLIGWVQSERPTVKLRAIQILGKMRASAADALDILRPIRNEMDEALSNAAEDAVRSIELAVQAVQANR